MKTIIEGLENKGHSAMWIYYRYIIQKPLPFYKHEDPEQDCWSHEQDT